jgi:heptosyltransferase-2
LDGLIVTDFRGKDKGVGAFWKLAKKLRDYHFDKIIDLQNSRRSHWLSFLSLPKESYGYDNGKASFLLSHRVKENRKDLPPVEHQFEVLKLMGISHTDNRYLEMWPAARDRTYAQELLESEWLGNCRNIVGVNIAASEKWQTKNWSIEHMAKLCDLLASRNIRVLITGMPKDRDLGRELISLTKVKPALLIGKTDILQLAAVIQMCKVYITPDSAPMHVAAAVQTPFIAFFGPTDSRRHIPPAKKFVILEKKLTCSPCYSSHCKILTHACMKEITPEQVVREIEFFMQEPVKSEN